MVRKQEKKQIFINARFLTQAITGVQRYAHELVRALDILLERGEIDKSQYDITLLAPCRGIIHDLPLKHIGVQHVARLTGHAWEQLELPYYARGGLLFCPGNTAPLASLLTGQPTVVTVHDLSYKYFPGAYSRAFRAWYNTLIPLVLSRAGAVITVSESEKKSILQYYPQAAGRLYAIQNGGLPGRVSTDSFVSPGDFVLYVGSLSSRKNLQGVLAAAALLNREEEVPFIVVGAGGKSFHNNFPGLPEHLLDRVDFKGQINDTAQIIRLYQGAACFVFPSFYEASPLPPIEAMACGCPVVSSTIPSLQERCGDAAIYCDPESPADIAAKVRTLLADPALRETMRQKGLARAGQFTWEECARRTFAVIRGVLRQT